MVSWYVVNSVVGYACTHFTLSSFLFWFRLCYLHVVLLLWDMGCWFGLVLCVAIGWVSYCGFGCWFVVDCILLCIAGFVVSWVCAWDWCVFVVRCLSLIRLC